MFEKPKRYVNEDNIKLVQDRPCVCCNAHPSDAHHLTTKGAGGGDHINNLINLCRKHHTEIHKIGLKKMCWKFPKIKEWLVQNKRFDLLERI